MQKKIFRKKILIISSCLILFTSITTPILDKYISKNISQKEFLIQKNNKEKDEIKEILYNQNQEGRNIISKLDQIDLLILLNQQFNNQSNNSLVRIRQQEVTNLYHQSITTLNIIINNDSIPDKSSNITTYKEYYILLILYLKLFKKNII